MFAAVLVGCALAEPVSDGYLEVEKSAVREGNEGLVRVEVRYRSVSGSPVSGVSINDRIPVTVDLVDGSVTLSNGVVCVLLSCLSVPIGNEFVGDIFCKR